MAIYYGDGSNSNNGRIIQHDEDYGSLSRYTINNGSWHEVDSGFRCAFTPKAVGNILKCTLVYNPVLNGGVYGAVIPVIHYASGGNQSLFGEQDGVGGIARGSILGNSNYISEQYRHNASYLFWQSCIVGTWAVTNAGEVHTLKMYAQMGSGDIIIGDNTLQCFMQMQEMEP